MKILHINKTYYPDTFGGIEQCIYQLCQGCARYGIESHVLTLSRNADVPTLHMDHHTVHRAKLDFEVASTGFSLSYFQKFIELASEADIIHYQYPWPFSDFIRLVSGIRKPAIISYQSDIVRQKYLNKLYRPLREDFLRSVDCIVTSSPNLLQTSDVLSRFQEKVRIVPIGLDKERYPVPTAPCLSRWQERVPDRFFLFIGATRYYKGLHILLEALHGMDYPVLIVGAGSEDEALKAQAQRLGLQHLRFLGALPDEDKVALLQLCHAVVLPSHIRTEAFGIALLEGAMYGKPLISTELGTGTTYINRHGETGLAVPPNDPRALRDAMRYLWENPESAEAMGRQAEARYWKIFTADQMVRGYIRIYEKVLGAARSR